MQTHQNLQQFINGSRVKGLGEMMTIRSPWTNSILASGPSTSKEDLGHAINCATKAQNSWQQLSLHQRTDVMFSIREHMLKALDELSTMISLESGKTVNEAKAGLLNGIEMIEFATSLKNFDIGGKLQLSKSVSCEFERMPLGVVCGITPFNFPAMVPLWMIPMALILGNAFIWKPSEKTPMTAIAMADIFTKAGLPAGLLNVLLGGPQLVHNLLEHPEIKAVGFVGSTPVAKMIYEKASANYKRVVALGGAKNHLFVLPDADFDLTVNTIVDSFTGCAGQRCMAASVLLAIGNTQAHIDKIIDAARAKLCSQNMGAIIDKGSLEKLEQAIQKYTTGPNAQGNLVLDGRKPKVEGDFKQGNWLAPTIIDHVKAGSDLANIELFGPILSIVRCKDVEEALSLEAANPYGNAASVFTQSGKWAQEISQRAKSAMIGINVALPVPKPPFSFGGMNESKFGANDITGAQSIAFWSTLKKITSRWSV